MDAHSVHIRPGCPYVLMHIFSIFIWGLQCSDCTSELLPCQVAGRRGQERGNQPLCPVQKVGGQIPPSHEDCSVCYRQACCRVDGREVCKWTVKQAQTMKEMVRKHMVERFTTVVSWPVWKEDQGKVLGRLILSFHSLVKKTMVCFYSSCCKLILKGEERT